MLAYYGGADEELWLQSKFSSESECRGTYGEEGDKDISLASLGENNHFFALLLIFGQSQNQMM